MLSLPIRNLFIEGPDCSGKTTLVRSIHQESNYRWHVFDRSQISRHIFSKLYERKNNLFDLHLELANLNNVYIILLPELSVIEKRFADRGDEIHDLNSIKEVYHAYQGSIKSFENFPNVHVISEEDPDIKDIVQNLCDYEKISWDEIAQDVEKFVDNTPRRESYPFEFTVYDTGEFQAVDEEILNYAPEQEYYRKIRSDFIDKIENELSGNNKYKHAEGDHSRRFVYSDEECISFLQVANRHHAMDFHCVLRSSNVRDLLAYDLKFLYFLARHCYQLVAHKGVRVRFRVKLNSAHILE